MRRLIKAPKPAILETNGAGWTKEYAEAALAGTERPKRWGHRQIRLALTHETGKRCAYCDANMMAVTTGNVEHILPRARHPELVVDWDNLTLACPRCNNTKKDYCDHTFPLLNPYTDDPDEHLIFVGSLVFSRPGSDVGAVTVLKLGLSRSDLVEARKRRLESISSLLDNWARAHGALKEAIRDVIREDVADGEFRKSVEALLRECRFPLDEES
ncbi:HNH endonuclease [Micromonospora carbonacea]|uniref:HNH endonuclease n=1 Tax=Micromonospora carbonacea TaxID=47853 RepID=A0A7H8XDQ1_9ACTN|nr:HNH endonuclease [Micromonospora carbonacea]